MKTPGLVGMLYAMIPTCAYRLKYAEALSLDKKLGQAAEAYSRRSQHELTAVIA